MTYRLGIDLGTTFTAAAVLRDGERPEALVLGERAAAVPSVVFLEETGRVLFGEAAEQRAPDAPERVARHFKRRIGDEVPLVLGATTEDRTEYFAHDLAAAVIAWVVALATSREGARPLEIAVTHPASWTERKLDLFRGALQAQNLPPVTLITEPEAAAVGYARTGLIPHPATVAVYDLGGGTLDVAVLARTADGGFVRRGTPSGVDGLGGVDFDDAILLRVFAAVDAESWAGFDGAEVQPDVLRALVQLRGASVAAKETLSAEPRTTITVALDGEHIAIPLERVTFDFLIAGMVKRSVDFFHDVVTAAGLAPEDLTCVLLTGGSAQVPLVTELLSERLPESVQILRAEDPKAVVAAGAVLSLRHPVGPAVPAPRRGADLAVAQARAFFRSQTASSAPGALPAAPAPPPASPVPTRTSVPGPRVDGPPPRPVQPTRVPAAVATEPTAQLPRQRRRVLTFSRIGVIAVLTGAVLVGGGFWLSAETPTVAEPASVSTPAKAAEAAGTAKAKAKKAAKAERRTAAANAAR